MTKNMIYYILIGGILIAGIIFSMRFNKKPKKEINNQENIYSDLRKMAFSTTAEQLELIEIDNDKVYGLVTEMFMNKGTATIVGFLSGDASIYLSSGGGFIGGGNHEDVNSKVKEIIDQIQKYKSKSIKIENADLPKQNEINFNFLTKNGIYQINGNMNEIMSEKSEFTELYKEVDKIMTLIRIKSER
jgi:hypothetical protein